MLRLLLSGCNGRMGRAVAALCARSDDVEIAAGIDLLGPSEGPFPVYSSPALFDAPADVAVDFSAPAALEGLLALCLERRLPLVLATTGHTGEQLAALRDAARQIPLFHAANFSLGVSLLSALVRRSAALLGPEWDIEIVERHHRSKADAPSGTALLLAEAAAQGLPQPPRLVCGRAGVRRKWEAGEIGVSSVRAGGIAGDHEVLFAAPDEVLILRHTALSREVYASGALRAARFLAQDRRPGLYSMEDLLGPVL